MTPCSQANEGTGHGAGKQHEHHLVILKRKARGSLSQRLRALICWYPSFQKRRIPADQGAEAYATKGGRRPVLSTAAACHAAQSSCDIVQQPYPASSIGSRLSHRSERANVTAPWAIAEEGVLGRCGEAHRSCALCSRRAKHMQNRRRWALMFLLQSVISCSCLSLFLFPLHPLFFLPDLPRFLGSWVFAPSQRCAHK